MAGGLRDLLALQGVIPLSKVVVTATPGLTLGQASGVWITGGNPSVIVATPGITLLQSMGVWITGATLVTARPVSPSVGGGFRGAAPSNWLEKQAREEEELLLILAAAYMEMIK